MALKRINRELKDAEDSPVEGVELISLDEDRFNLKAWIVGEEGSVYEGGLFGLTVKLPKDYPFKPPDIKFSTKVYHPNINARGDISCCGIYCNSCSQSTWSPALTIQRTLFSIRGILSDPCPDDPLVPEIAKQFKSNRA
jgi:ubiquitin-conjugating enzyme E2 D